jgi:hypothetical protein
MIKLDKNVINKLHMKDDSREVKFRYDILNYNEIKIGELTPVPKGRLGLNSLAQIKRTGSFNFRENELKEVDWLNDRVQPFFMLKMGNEWLEWSLGVFLISSPRRNVKNNAIYREVECYDTSLILLEDKFDDRYRIPAGTNYVEAVTRIINEAGIWKINISPVVGSIKTDKEFEIGTSRLEAVNELLKEINYTSIWVDETGCFTSKPYILPTYRAIEYEYRNDDMSIILPETAIEEMDLFNIPNKWVVVATNPETEPLVSRYTNDNAGSPTSTVGRKGKRNIVDHREENDILDQKTLDEYVRRIAYEASQVYTKFIFETAIMPHHSYMDSLFCEHTGLGISNKYIETSWQIDLKAGGKMQHSARRVIQI